MIALLAAAPLFAGPILDEVLNYIHLANHQRDSQFRSGAFAPMRNVSLRVALPEEARQPEVRRLWEDRDLASQVNGRTLHVKVGTLDEYEAIAVEW